MMDMWRAVKMASSMVWMMAVWTDWKMAAMLAAAKVAMLAAMTDLLMAVRMAAKLDSLAG
jgi:hypothetical protein